jgi:hypothetical protein
MAALTLDTTDQLDTHSVESVAFGVTKLVLYYALYSSLEARTLFNVHRISETPPYSLRFMVARYHRSQV